MDLHYYKDCRYLTPCIYCQSIIEIPEMRAHWITECAKMKELRQCQRCKQIITEDIFEKHTLEQKCTPNPKDDPACTMCGTNIASVNKNIQQGWKDHLIKQGCINNPRK